MAPSSRNRTTIQHQRPQASVFRVTKSSKLNERPESHLKQKISAIEAAISENAPPVQTPKVAPSQIAAETATPNSKKRRRDSNVNNTDVEIDALKCATKRAKKIVAVSPSLTARKQRDGEGEQLPEVLQELSQLHKHFLHALSVHYAHTEGGIRDVVDLAALLPTMTRLWRKRAVQVQDVQRVLALWELNSGTMAAAVHAADSEIVHSHGPFKMEQVGVGANGTVTLEYTWTDTNTKEALFIETELQRRYEARIHELIAASYQRDEEGPESESCIWKSLRDVPKLRCETGKLTQLRRDKVASIKSRILSKTLAATPASDLAAAAAAPALQPDLSRLSIHGPNSPPRKSQDSSSSNAKSRTIGLFDRVRAKQLFNATATTFTPAQLLRQRALQRIPELVDVLRLKQARKLTGHGPGQQQMRVSFSLEALVQEIKDSLRSEVASEEIREGIVILGRDVPGKWCRVYEMGSVRCVTLQGEAMARKEFETWCKAERDKMTNV